MSINIEFTVGEVRIHACKTLHAKAGGLSDVHWLTITNQRNEEVTFFMPQAAAEAYASAINSCNDREAADAREDTDSNG